VIKCRPPGNRRPRRREIDACKPYLKAQMDVHNPRVVCLMGNVAAKAVLGRQGIMTLRGKVLLDRFLVTYHPAAVLRNRNLMEQFVSDLRSALGFK
jgi:DNA polymerase